MDINNRGKIHCPPRMLEVRIHFRWLGSLLITSFIFFTLLFLISSLYYFYQTQEIAKQLSVHLLQISISIENTFHLMLYSGLLAVILLLIYWFLFKDMMGAQFQAFNNHFIIKKKKKEIKIFYKEILSIKCGGFGPLSIFKVKSNSGRVYRLSTMIERADYIIEAILRFNAKLMPWAEFVVFRNKLVVSDHRLARFEESYYGRYSWIAFLHLAFLPIAFLSMLYIEQTNRMTIHSIFGHILIGLKLIIIVNLGLWLFYQFVLKWVIDKKELIHLMSNLKDKRRDMVFESRMFKGAYACIFSVCLLFYFCIYRFELNRYEFILALENFDSYHQAAGTIHLIDTRYNCQQCNYSVKKGDVVVILKPKRAGKFLAKIQGLSGELVNLNYLSDENQGRTIASTPTMQEKVLAKSEVAAITGRNGEYISPILEEQIHGKVVLKIAAIPKIDQSFFINLISNFKK